MTRTLTASLSDIDRVWAELEVAAPHLFSQLIDFRLALQLHLTAEKPPYYGWNFAELIGKLPLPENILDIIMELEGMSPDWLDIFSEDSVNMDSVELEGMSVAEHKQLKRQLASTRQLLRREPFDKVRELPVNWLLATRMVLFNVVAGSLGIQWGKLTITLRDGRLPGVAQAMKFNLFMDATGSRADLALALGVPEHTIAHIEQAPPSYSNLTIVQVNGFDTASNQRSESTDIRIAVAKAKLRELHSDIAIIDHLAKLEEGDDAHHFGNLVRGSNVFSDRSAFAQRALSAIASFGMPAPNKGALLHYYIAITGKCLVIDSPEFETFYCRKVQAEIIQEVGRLRAQRRPGAQLYFYLGTDIDPEFLAVAFPGCRISRIDAFNITPDAATPKEQTRWAILQAFKAIAETGGQLLTTAVANAVGITQGRLSQIAAEFGGWKRLKRLLASLYKQLNRAANNSQDDAKSLDAESLWIAQTYLPLVVDDWLTAIPTASEVVALLKIPGWRTFERMIREMPLAAVAKLLGVFGGMLAQGGLELAIDPDGG